jgi:flagellar M-ring protein FliF
MTFDPVPAVGWQEMLGRQLGSFVNAGALILITALLVWFGVRPAMRAILEAPAPEAAPAALAAAGGQDQVAIDPVMAAMLGGRPGAAPTSRRQSSGAGDPSLIDDLTEKLDRAPQKRLEQMVDFDEEQAAAILKQWLREAEPA